jgi:hypothetical protein
VHVQNAVEHCVGQVADGESLGLIARLGGTAGGLAGCGGEVRAGAKASAGANISISTAESLLCSPILRVATV